MIYAGIIAGVIAYYWLMPKWVAARIIRRIELINRLDNERKQNP